MAHQIGEPASQEDTPFEKGFLLILGFVTGLVFLFVALRLVSLTPIYVSSEVRSDVTSIWQDLSKKEGLGLSKLQLDRVRCHGMRCELQIQKEFHAPFADVPLQFMNVPWTVGSSTSYVVD